MKTNKKFILGITTGLALMLVTSLGHNPMQDATLVDAAIGSEYNYPEKDTFRVFIDRQTHYIDGFFYEIVYAPTEADLTNNTESVKRVSAKTGGKYSEILKDEWILYLDAPLDLIGSYFKLNVCHTLTDGTDQIDSSTPIYQFDKEQHVNKILYISWNNNSIDCSFGLRDTKKTNASFLTNVFSELYTCDPNDIYGYNAIPTIVDTWIHDGGSENLIGEGATWYTEGNLGDCTVNDYVLGNDGTILEETQEIDLWTKFQKMVNMYEIHNNDEPTALAGLNLNNNATIVISVSICSIVAMAGLFAALIISKKRKENN